MKKILFILMLLPILSIGQKIGAKVIEFDSITSTVRDTYTVPYGKFWLIFNGTTGQFEYSDGSETWEAFGSGTITGTEPAFNGWDKDASDDFTNPATQNLNMDSFNISDVQNLNAVEGSFSALSTSSFTTNTATITGVSQFSGLALFTSGFRTTPTDIIPSGAHGQYYADLSETRPKYFDGTSWKAFVLDGDVAGTDDQTLSLSGTGNTTLNISEGNSVLLPTLGNTDQFIPASQIRTTTPGISGSYRLNDSSGRTWFDVTSNAVSQSEGNGYIGENVTFREHGGTADDIINLNFDFDTGVDKTLVATPTTLTYGGVDLMGGGGFANPATVNLDMAGFDVSGAGNVTLNPSGSTTTTPALLGFTGFTTGQATRFQFGDRYNSIQNGFGTTMDISSYHTLRLRGGTTSTPVNTDFQDGTVTPDIGILMETFNANRKIVVRGIASQAVDIFQVRNSADAVLFGIKNTGQGLFNQGLDMGATKITNLATPTVNTDAATKAYVDSNAGNPLAIESDITGLTGASAISNIVSGTQSEIDGWTTDSTRLDLCEDCPPATQTTGTVLDLGNYIQYNMSSPNSAATYTTTNVKGGGYAEVLINKSGSAPTVTGATQLPNTATFIASTNMIMSVKAFGTTVKYWFTEY